MNTAEKELLDVNGASARDRASKSKIDRRNETSNCWSQRCLLDTWKHQLRTSRLRTISLSSSQFLSKSSRWIVSSQAVLLSS
eukprot:651900-Amphidinium_carterae.1